MSEGLAPGYSACCPAAFRPRPHRVPRSPAPRPHRVPRSLAPRPHRVRLSCLPLHVVQWFPTLVSEGPPPTAPKIFNVAPTLNKTRGSSGYIRVIFSLVRKRSPSGSNPNPGSFLDGAWGRRRSPLGRGRGGRFVRPRRWEGLSGARGRWECAEPRQARWQVEKERGKMGAGARSG